MQALPIADIINPGVLALSIPVIALLIPIVAILVHHQQKMAQIVHGSNREQDHAAIESLRREMMELKHMVAQQTLALDDLADSQRKLAPPAAPNDIRERLQS